MFMHEYQRHSVTVKIAIRVVVGRDLSIYIPTRDGQHSHISLLYWMVNVENYPTLLDTGPREVSVAARITWDWVYMRHGPVKHNVNAHSCPFIECFQLL